MTEVFLDTYFAIALAQPSITLSSLTDQNYLPTVEISSQIRYVLIVHSQINIFYIFYELPSLSTAR
ncbi:MAG: hypothetical protein HC836_46100 [Richelia sp. RM2_1_2]|nr:hypothetical protein [Richelia sp. SM2_1_7]NJM23426.1 hypothetical protein [Richelia sp. SM1_7_0]NJN13496.1 hypothetical protein [Richelia sp. RM1_1_1]NJO31512.1 hypothetical protein [Richelia sp. SL_2_1]NJO65221.1 hypothetical protein [Richelia sp. RM2_1_2]